MKTIKKKIKKTPSKVRKVSTKKKKNGDDKSIEEESFDLDPRRQAFAVAFYDPTSDTYGQLVPSGLKAGFTETYSQNLTNVRPQWLLRIIEKMDIMDTVKRNIKKHLELKTEVPVMTAFGPYIDKKTKKMIYHEDAKLLKIQQDMTMFVAEKIIPDYKRKEKFELPLGSVEIKQIFIIAPDGKSIDYNSANSEAISSIPETSGQ